MKKLSNELVAQKHSNMSDKYTFYLCETGVVLKSMISRISSLTRV